MVGAGVGDRITLRSEGLGGQVGVVERYSVASMRMSDRDQVGI